MVLVRELRVLFLVFVLILNRPRILIDKILRLIRILLDPGFNGHLLLKKEEASKKSVRTFPVSLMIAFLSFRISLIAFITIDSSCFSVK